MSHALRSDAPSVEVWQPTRDEWNAYIEAGLSRLGVTYEELARQARERNFQSAEAMSFWVVIGESEV
jgi:hypothetical protein